MNKNTSIVLKNGTLLNNYEIINHIGSGGFGITYLAKDINRDLYVAIKEYFPVEYALRSNDGLNVISNTQNSSEDLYQWGLTRFIQEAEILSQFNYPTIVKTFDYFQKNGSAYIVMEYYQGETLGDYIKQNKNLSQEDIIKIIMPILEGLKEVHSKGYLHRDISPDNILLRDNNLPVLIDFGSARYALGTKSGDFSAIIKPHYSPPEQYSNSKQTEATDIYAISALMYEMVTNKKPPESINRQIDILEGNPDVVEDIVNDYKDRYSIYFLEAIKRGLAIHIDDRIQSVKELQEEIIKDFLTIEDEKDFINLDKYFHNNRDKFYTEDEILSFIFNLLKYLKELENNRVEIFNLVLPDRINYKLKDGEFKFILHDKNMVAVDKDHEETLIIKRGYTPLEAYQPYPILTAASSVYSLGAILYRMVTGKKLFDPIYRKKKIEDEKRKDPAIESLKECENIYSSTLLNSIKKAISIERKDRFQTLQEFEEALKGEIDLNESNSFIKWLFDKFK